MRTAGLNAVIKNYAVICYELEQINKTAVVSHPERLLACFDGTFYGSVQCNRTAI